jgi:hypothetical protein
MRYGDIFEASHTTIKIYGKKKISAGTQDTVLVQATDIQEKR